MRTRRSAPLDVKKLAEQLSGSLSGLLGSESPPIRLCVHRDQLCEECDLIVTAVPGTDQQTFSIAALNAYLELTEDCTTPCNIPPTIVHGVCFLPTGHIIRYTGSGKRGPTGS